MMHYPLEETLPKVRSNTLVISGALDTLCPPEWIDQVMELLPSGRVEIIEDAAHSIMHAHADTVAELAVAHVRHPGTGPLPTQAADRAANGAHGDSNDGDSNDGDSDDGDASPDGLAEFTGQLTELAGILTDDDEKIAEGKTAQAQAIAEASESPRDLP